MKRIVLVLGVICVMLVLCSCLTVPMMIPPIIYDESVPLEQSCRILFSSIEITAYNGIPVPYSKGNYSTYLRNVTVSEWTHIVLPAGEIEFTGDIILSNTIKNTRTYYVIPDVVLKYRFEPGKNYTIRADWNCGPDKNERGIEIYNDIPTHYSGLVGEVIAFIPIDIDQIDFSGARR
jgi:hypothetical protein